MIDLEDKVDDIVEIYINRLYNTDKTVGVVVNKEIAEYILDNLIRLDETSIKEIDFVDYMNIGEYLVSVDNGGVITVVPIESLGVLDKTDIFYIDMDGDISQDIIDYCVNEDKKVILFGQEDDCDCDGDCENCPAHDETTTSTSYEVNRKSVDKETYEKAVEDIKDIEEKYLDGVRETVGFENNSSLMLFDNTDYEEYPVHWHTPIELIMPTEGTYDVDCNQIPFHMRKGDIIVIIPGTLHHMKACHGRRIIFQVDMNSGKPFEEFTAFLPFLQPAVLITPEEAPAIHEEAMSLMFGIRDEYLSDTPLYETSVYAKFLQLIVLIGRQIASTPAKFPEQPVNFIC